MSPKWLPIPRALVKYSASPCTAPQGLISGSSPIPNLLMILKQGTGVICLLPMGFWTLGTQDTDSEAEGRSVGPLLVDCWWHCNSSWLQLLSGCFVERERERWVQWEAALCGSASVAWQGAMARTGASHREKQSSFYSVYGLSACLSESICLSVSVCILHSTCLCLSSKEWSPSQYLIFPVLLSMNYHVYCRLSGLENISIYLWIAVIISKIWMPTENVLWGLYVACLSRFTCSIEITQRSLRYLWKGSVCHSCKMKCI